MVTRHSSPTHRATRRDLKIVSKLGGASLIVIAALAMSANPAQAQTEDVVCADAATGAPIASQQAAAALASGVQVICGAGAQATGDGAIAVGKNAKATGQSDSIAIGTDSEATGVSAVAAGDTAKALGARTVAIGNNARAGRGPNDGAGAVAVGNGAQALTNGTVSVGQNAGGGATNAGTSRVAIGDNAGTNVDGNTNTAVGAQSGQTIKGVNNTALGYQAGRNVHGIISLVNGMNNTAIGTRSGNVVSGSRNTTVGWEAGSNVTGFDNISFGGQSGINVQGRQNTANGYYAGSGIQGSYNVASGTAAGANVTGSYNIALGDHAGTLTRVTVASDGQPDFSSSARLTVSDSIALGRETQVGGDNAMAIGSLANATLANSVALGANAVADTVIGTASGTIAGTTYNYAGSVPLSTVSIGKAGEERTITNLAAGRVDATSTDAVNGSQLAATNAALDEAAAAADNSVQYDDPDKTSVTLGGVASSDGGVTNGTKITNVAQGNVADGSTDAVNGTQLYQVQQQMLAGQTHYVSINDGGVQGGNYNNDGALGRDSIAIGVNTSTAAGAQEAIAIGARATANSSVGVAISSDAVSNQGGIAIGALSLANGDGVSVGLGAGMQSSGLFNTYVGSNSGISSVGDLNSAFGIGSGRGVTGNANLALGGSAGQAVIGDYNLSVGQAAGANTNGSNNASVGVLAGSSLSGNMNAGLGYAANIDVTGDRNAALGYSAGAVTNGNDNSAIGFQAGIGTNGNQNVAMGYMAGAGNAGNNNILVGTQAGVQIDPNDPNSAETTTANDVIALGQSSLANQDTAVAIGKDATAKASVGDVALGAGSVTDLAVGTASGTIAGITYNYAGTNPLSTVSVGAVGAERTVTNVAAGRVSASSTDAINGSQLAATNDAVEDAILQAQGNTAALGGGAAYDPATNLYTAPSYVTSTGTYNNVGDALVAGNNQINLLGNSVASGLGGTSSYDQTTGQLTTALTVGGVNYSDVNSALNAVGAQAGAGWTVTTDASGTGESVATLGDYTVEPGENLGITAGNNMIITQDGTDLEFAVNPNLKITSVTTGNTVMNNDGVTVNGGANGPVSLTNNGLNNGGNVITNVAAGVNDTDAVNVSQLAAATQAGTNADERAVKYDWTDLDGDGVVDPGEVDYSKATLAGVDGTTIDNLAPGTIDATSMQAVNGSQIHANQQSLANALGGGSVVNADGTLGAPSYVTSTGTYNNVGDALVAGNNQTNALGNSVASGLGGTSSYDPVTGQVTTGLSVGGTDYSDVNSALNAVSTQASAGWNVTTGAVGSGIVNGSSLANVAPGATHTITAGDNIVATQNGTEVQLAVNPDLNVTSVTTGNTVMDNDGVTVNGGANGPVSLTGNGLDNGGNTITNVAAGVNDTDAVNVAQLNQTNQQVTDLSNRTDTLGESVASGLGGNSSYDPLTGQVTTDLNVGGTSYTDVNSAINAINATANAGWNIQANGGAASNIATNGTLNVTQGSNTQVTLQGNELQVAVVDNPTFSGMVTANGGLTVGAGQTVDMGGNVVTNVGAGAVNATSTDAVNGSQLYAASMAAQNSVQYDEGHTSVTFNPGGDAIQLHNVAAGTAPTDAVNVAQLNAGMNDAVARANSYTDSRIMMLEYDLGNARRDANAGTAGALAAAGLPQAYEPGKGMIAGGVGYYDGQTAFAIGGSRVSDDGRIIVKAGATYNTRGRAGANVGVGYQF